MNEFRLPNGQRLIGVHSLAMCKGRYCVVHNPMRTYDRNNLWWREDRIMFEVICAHGVGHPAPEQYGYWDELNVEWMGVHGCDGCCEEWEYDGD